MALMRQEILNIKPLMIWLIEVEEEVEAEEAAEGEVEVHNQQI